MGYRIRMLFEPFVIAMILIGLFAGCSGVSRSLNKMVLIREARKDVEKLPVCPEDSYPIDKVEIAPTEVKIDFNSIFIFHSGTDLGVINGGITPEQVLDPSLKLLTAKGFIANLGYDIDINEIENYVKCRHCGNLTVENQGFHPFDQDNAKKDCFFTGKDYTAFFRHLINKYPETDQYQTIALIMIYLDFGAIKPRMFLFDKRKQVLALEGQVREKELRDDHNAPSGYRFVTSPRSNGEDRLTTVRRALDKMLEIFPNISGNNIPPQKKAQLRKVFSYQYHLGNTPPTATEIKVSNTPPQYWTFRYINN